MWIIPADAKKPADDRAFHVVQKKEKAVKPFLKWAGGKYKIIDRVREKLPNGNGVRLIEPFVG